jgi:hypothetical protein
LIGVGPVLLLAAEAHQVLEGDVAEVCEEQNLQGRLAAPTWRPRRELRRLEAHGDGNPP